ncbi:MAG: alpha/beta hydrolase family protein, partial [Streptosporangiaceae bacterium]
VGGSEKIRVILPKGWSRKAKRTWPVVYAYHGGNDTYLSWARSSQLPRLAAQWDVITVLPSGGTHGGYTNWYNYGNGGSPRWETFHTVEVLQLLERNYRAGKKRAALGISSGGQGAITYAARHPGMFRYAASFSGILHLTRPGMPALIAAQNLTFGDAALRMWGIPGWDDRNWKAHDPYELAARLRGTGLYVSSGTTGLPGPYDPDPADPYNVLGSFAEANIGPTALDFTARLKQLKIPATVHLYRNGWHNWKYWRDELTRAWPLMMKSLQAAKVK